MGIKIKKFNFISDTETWTATPSDATYVTMDWFKLHPAHSSGRSSPILSTLGGCLKTTAKRDASAGSNYWEWTGTWEDLGVPPGATITDVTATYQWRIEFGKPNRVRNFSLAEFTGTEVGSGPFELLDSGGTLIDTFSAITNAPERNAGVGYYRSYPTGSASDYPITADPTSWETVSSSTIVPTGSDASGDTIKLRLWNDLPNIANSGFANPDFIRLKQDYVVLTINYTGGSNTGGWFFFFNS